MAASNSSQPVAAKLEEPLDIPLPVLISAICGVVLVVVVTIVTIICCTKRCRPFGKHGWKLHEALTDSNYIKISHSLPNLDKANYDMEAEKQGNSQKSTKVWRQTTLPTVPQRHWSFQQHLPRQVDWSNVAFSIHSVKHKEQPSIGKLKPELYKYSISESISGELTLCGKLTFSLVYDPEQEALVIKIISAVDLPAKDFSGTSDPYVKLYLLPDRKKKFQTKVHRKTLNPVFDETFYFHVRYTELCERTLQFSIYDFDRFSRHDLIGHVVIKDLFARSDLTKEIEYVKDVIGNTQEKVDLGEVMMSLCYLPTAGRLTVTIVKARNLKAMDVMGSSDPYVKVSLMCQGKRIKKKKTSVKKNTLNPVYNEAIVFDVPAENVEEISLIIKVIDYDRVGNNELIGSCAVGPCYVGLGRDHWFEMLENPRKPIAHWYSLQEHLPGISNDRTPNGGSGVTSNRSVGCTGR